MLFNRTNSENEQRRILASLQCLFMKQLALPSWKSSQHNYDNHEIKITHSSGQDEKQELLHKVEKIQWNFFK